MEDGGEGLSRLELLVLSSVERLGAQAFGTSVHREVERRARRRASLGSIYGALTRLEARGLLIFRHGAPFSATRGRSSRLAEVTPAGLRTIAEARDELARILGMVRESIRSANPAG